MNTIPSWLDASARICLWFFIYSFAGWLYETILVSAQSKRFVDRGFLNGPLCPIYGSGALLAILLFSHLDALSLQHVLIVFIASSVGACLLEYVTSWTMEKLFHARWWDYSHFKFNLNGRICLLGAIVFGLGGCAIVFLAQPFVDKATDMMPEMVLVSLSTVFALLALIDFIITVSGLVDFEKNIELFKNKIAKEIDFYGEKWDWGKEATRRWIAEHSPFDSKAPAVVSEGIVEDTANVMKDESKRFVRLPDFKALFKIDLRKVFSFQQLRMLRSFPRLRFVTDENNDSKSEKGKTNKILETIREFIKI